MMILGEIVRNLELNACGTVEAATLLVSLFRVAHDEMTDVGKMLRKI